MMNYDDISRRLSCLYDPNEARAITRLVLEERFGLTLADILCGKDTQLSADDHAELEKIVQRLEKSEPVQYVLGQATFCGRSFYVAPGVLIPRPETAELCQWIIDDSVAEQHRQDQGDDNPVTSPRILDIGTGSGCIAVTLALGMADADVVAIDISPEALAIARCNAQRLGAAVAFIQHDILASRPSILLDATSASRKTATHNRYTVIVSNPPYVCRNEAELMEPNVLRHEPHQALFVPDEDPLLFYRAIAKLAHSLLMRGGMLYFEINPLYVEQLHTLLIDEGFADVKVRSDQFGKQRFMAARFV